MKKAGQLTKNPRNLIGVFVTGSLVVLLLCLFGTALSFSITFFNKEKQRAAVSLDQLQNSFDFELRSISEEMWTHSYDAIVMRIDGIAKRLGHAAYEVMLADENGRCVYSADSAGKTEPACETQPPFQQRISATQSLFNSLPVLTFDLKSNRYVYFVPLQVGAVPKGYLYTTISDPYEFYHGNSVAHVTKVFIFPIFCILLIWCLWLVASKRFILRPYLSSLVDLERKQAIAELAAQVAHDIRAPLVTARSVIRKLRGLDQTQMRLLNTAHSRMENIANELIDVYITSNRVESQRFSFVSATVDSIISEKTAMLGDDSCIEIVADIGKSAMALGIPVSASDFSRVLSNLLNNSIEALRDQAIGSITISVENIGNMVRVTIADNGRGMTKEVLHKISTVGGSFGRSRGAGLGLQHAKATIGEAHGTLTIRSAPENGTVVTLEIPLATPPAWFARSLTIGDQDKVVVLDDDESVHLFWKGKLSDRKLVHLRDPEEFDINQYNRESCRFIFDYEISGTAVTGLDLIVSYGLGARAVLVTSYFNEPKIQQIIERAGASILPKFMMCDVEISKPSRKKQVVAEAPRLVDLVLIDDDPLVHELWAFEAKQQDKQILTVSRLNELEGKSFDFETPIYVDKNLKDGQCGLVVAQTLHERGFKSIYLATGERIEPENAPPFLRGVLGKDFPVLN